MLAIAAAGVLLRLVFLAAPEGNDEGGYLAVARQWHGAGTSLYGRYWVDRPPLLVMLFQLADALGGLPALRVIGALCAGVAVLGVAAACAKVGGGRAASWGAAVAAALFASPQLGTVQVNGELLAAPFVAWSIAGGVDALRAPARAAARAGFLAGALAVAALLVKQNMAEPFVFGSVMLWVARRTGRLGAAGLRRVVSAAALGAAATLVVVGAWTVSRGTSLTGVFDAMYPFRVRAAGVLAQAHDQGQVTRSHALLQAWLTSGLVLLLALFGWSLLRRRLGGPVAWGLAATLTWATASSLLGGGFWDHYLVELIVPAGLAAGVMAGRRPAPRHARGLLVPSLVAALVVVVALTHWVGGFGATLPNRGVAIGTAIATVAQPGDTLVSAVGDAETVDASRLASPYPYLWTLPAQVDDPRLDRLTALLQGPGRPTWFVGWGRPSFPAAALRRLEAAVAAHYDPVGTVCGRTVFVRTGVFRRPPPPDQACSGAVARR